MTRYRSRYDRYDRLLRRCLRILRSANHAVDIALAAIYSGEVYADLVGDVEDRQRQRGRLIHDIEVEMRK